MLQDSDQKERLQFKWGSLHSCVCVCACTRVWWVITVIIEWLISIRGTPWFLFWSPASLSLKFYIILITLLLSSPLLSACPLLFLMFHIFILKRLFSLLSLSSPEAQLCNFLLPLNNSFKHILMLQCLEIWWLVSLPTSHLFLHYNFWFLFSSKLSFHVLVFLVLSSSAAVHNVLPGQILSQRADEDQGGAHQVNNGLWLMGIKAASLHKLAFRPLFSCSILYLLYFCCLKKMQYHQHSITIISNYTIVQFFTISRHGFASLPLDFNLK